jgi:hypothetical protein
MTSQVPADGHRDLALARKRGRLALILGDRSGFLQKPLTIESAHRSRCLRLPQHGKRTYPRRRKLSQRMRKAVKQMKHISEAEIRLRALMRLIAKCWKILRGLQKRWRTTRPASLASGYAGGFVIANRTHLRTARDQACFSIVFVTGESATFFVVLANGEHSEWR